MNKKIEAKRYKLDVYGKDDMQNYKLSFNLLEIENIGDYIKLTVGTDIEYNYKNTDLDSAYSESTQLILSKNNNEYKVEDWYVFSDSYDMELRGELREIENLNYWSVKKRSASIIQKQQELNNKIKSYYDDLKIQSEWFEDDYYYDTSSHDISPYATLYSLNRNNMVTWANNNCTKTNPASGNLSLTPYYDFSKIANAWDCTNFVSHALLAGGSVLYDTGGSGISSTGWYYRNLSNRSSSWSGVTNLYSFLTSNKTKGPAGRYLAYTNIYPSTGSYPYRAGDLLQFYSSSYGNWRHSTVITGYIAVSGSSTTLEAIVTGRSSGSSYNKNQRQSTIYAGQNRRIIKMSGYYK